MRIWTWLRTAALDLRGGGRAQFAILIACLALGVGTIAAVGSVGASLQQAIAQNATALLGGTAEAQLSYRAANPDERKLFDTLGKVSEVIELNARASANGKTVFLALRAGDGNYPLIGTVDTSPAGPLQPQLAQVDDAYGAVVDQRILDQLGIALGDRFSIGTAQFIARSVLVALPDQAGRGFVLGQPIIVSTAGLRAAGLLGEGVIARYRYKMLLTGEFDAAATTIKNGFPDAGWQVRAPQDAASGLRRFFDLFARFLVLVGLSTLVVGGVGVANAVTAYLSSRQAAIATMRSLGATGSRILAHFLFQVLVLCGIGIVVGLVLGAVGSTVLLPIIGGLLSLQLAPDLDFPALGIAAAYGILIGFTFALLPLARTRAIQPALLFRSGGAGVEGRLWRELRSPGIAVAFLVGLAGIVGLAVLTSGRPSFVAWYAGGMLGGFVVLRLAGWVLQLLLRLLPPLPSLPARLGLGGILRNRGATATIVTSLGLGLTLLLLIALIDGNLRQALQNEIVDEAPSFVLFNVDQSSRAELDALVESDERITSYEVTPVIRGAFTHIAGKTPAEFGDLPPEVAPIFRGDQPFSWSHTPPPDSKIASGEWWPDDYSGSPLASVDELLREPLGLKLGDSIEITVSGRPITATISNFRHIDERRPAADFSVVLSPGLIEKAPATYIASIKAAEGSEPEVERELADDFPTIPFVPISQALDQVGQLIGSLANAVAIVGGVAVASGMLVLAGALSAGRQRRESEAVVIKVLGATRRTVLTAYLIEYGLLGALATLVAAALGTLGAWAVTTRVFELNFALDWGRVVLVLVGAVIATIAVGLVTTGSVLSVRPARRLRGD